LISAVASGGSFNIAVIVVNFNGGELLMRCLESIRSQSLTPWRVIVVDNASGDGSADAAAEKFPEFTITRLTNNTGFAAANNLAIKAATDCEWIALLNPDAYAAPDWLRNMCRAIQRNPDFAFFGSRMLIDDNPEKLDGTGDVYHISGLVWRSGHGANAASQYLRSIEIFSPCAAAALYQRKDLLAVGGFDEEYFCYVEDVDLGFRLRSKGLRCLYVPDAVVRHTGSALTGRRSDFSIYHGHRNLEWTYIKNMPAALFWLMMPLHVVMNLITIVSLSLLGKGGVILRAKRDAVKGVPLMWRKRRVIQMERTASTADIWRVLDKGFWLRKK
jgi:GT2 family glycosyltransferase